MLDYFWAFLSILIFLFSIEYFGLLGKTRHVVKTSRDALNVLTNTALDDRAKESAMQGYAKILFSLFFLITIGVGTAILAPMALVWALDVAGILSSNAVMNALLSWEMVVGGTILMFVFLYVRGLKSYGV